VIAVEPQNVRALYARGVARQTLAQLAGDDRLYDAAEEDIREAYRINSRIIGEMDLDGIVAAAFRPPGLPSTESPDDAYSGSPVLSQREPLPSRPAGALDRRAVVLFAALLAAGFAIAVWRRRPRA
jgi:hypothetical protein